MSRDQDGMTFVEVLVAMLLTTFVVFACLSFTTSGFQTSGHNRDKQIATQKAISMIEELKSIVQIEGNSASMLDAYDDSGSYNTILTADRTITDPAASVSGNVELPGGDWKYTRQITVSPVPGSVDNSVRLVSVKVCLNEDQNGDGDPDILGEVAGVIRTPGYNAPPTQTYDVYALAIENVPGWWVHMRSLIPFVQNTVQELQSRNPGLEFRVHWITKLAYGRDPHYRPYINASQDSRQPINWVYYYPGLMPSGSAIDFYYPPDNFKGHILVDSTDTNGYDATTNPYPYSLADNFNAAMRYPDELALFDQRVAAGLESDDEPTFRILLERMYRDPFTYRNAILINLHGELLPFPPVRNYSDAAKEPIGLPNVRVVTHPENLRYLNTAPKIALRVYSYRTDPTVIPATNGDWLGQNAGTPVPIVVTLKGISWTPNSGSSDIQAIQGGTDQVAPTGTADPYQVVNATTTASSTGMYYSSTTVGGDTILYLYNSPLRCPEVLVSGTTYAGLNASERLYGMDYVPAPLDNLPASSSAPTPFTINLASTHTVSSGACSAGICNKNTARWIINVPPNVLPGGTTGNDLITVETRIGSTDSGTRTNQPTNLSRTYTWKGTDTWVFGDGTAANPPNLPITEMYQFQGDPRHLPYADLKSPHYGSGLPLANKLGMGYNRYFDDFENSSGNKGTTPGKNWQGWYYTVSGVTYGIKNDSTTGNDSWKTSTSQMELDVNRMHQVLRTVLTASRSVFTTMTGFSFYYLGIGGEIGYDAASGFTNSIPVSAKPYDGSTGTGYEQAVIQGSTMCTPSATWGCGFKYIRSGASSNYWWGISWLGELYPDAAYAGSSGWETVGNLPTGAASSTTFRRALRANVTTGLPAGTSFLDVGRMPEGMGCTSFYYCGTASSTFHHSISDGTGTLQTAGTALSTRYNYPLSSGIPIARPFNTNISATGTNPDHFLQAPYGAAQTAARRAYYYNHSVKTSDNGSAVLTFSDASNNAMFVAVNGISMVGRSGSSFMSAYAMLTLIDTFIAGGKYNSGGTGHIEQLPRVVLTSPNYATNLDDPSSVSVSWSRTWLRWDGQAYSSEYASGYSESSALSYTVMYSDDDGATWHYMQNGALATPGVRPTDTSVLISSASATNNYTWSTPPGTFPQGAYLIRVECYRDALPLHYASHQYKAFIRRTT